MKIAIIAAAALAFASHGAFAKTYSIQDNSYCDHLTVTETGSLVVGNSDVGGCDAAIVVGNKAKVAVNPTGSVLELGTDFGNSPQVGVILVNLKAKTITYYFTADGTGITEVDDTITVTSSKLTHPTAQPFNGKRSVLSTLRHK